MSAQDGSRIQIGREEFDPRPLRPQPLRPEASPVDTYSAPNAGAEMQQLASALSGIAPELRQYTGIFAQREQESAQEQATTAASKAHENRLGYADAVKKGLIKPNDNPWFQYYFQQQSGALAAGDYGAALEGEMKTNPAWAESTDPNDFAKLEGQFRKQWMKDNVGDKAQNPHFAATFSKIMDGVTQDAARQFSDAAGARMQIRAGDQLNQLLNQTIDRSFQKNESPEALVQQINAINDRYLADNPKAGKIANLATVQAIQSYALLHPEQAEQVFALAKNIKAGPGGNLDGIKEYRAMVADTRAKIVTEQAEKLRVQQLTEEHEDRTAERGMWSDLVNTISNAKDPQSVDLTPFITRAKQFGNSDQVVERIMGLRQAFAERNAFGNENTFRRASLQVYGVDPEDPGHYLSMSQLAGMLLLDPGLRISPTQFTELAQKIQERDKATDEGRVMKEMNILTNPVFVEGKQLLTDAIMDPANPTQAQRTNLGLALENFTDAYLKNIDKIAAEPDREKRFKLVQDLVHDAAAVYAPDFARAARQESEGAARENARKKGVFDQVIANIKTPEERRTVTGIEREIEDLNQRPFDANHNRRPISEATLRFLYNHGMGQLYKPGTALSIDDINDFLSEYRQVTQR